MGKLRIHQLQARWMGGKMKVKPCTCGELPDLESSTYGWDSKQEALDEWNKAHS
jgi:hypothetical protein